MQLWRTSSNVRRSCCPPGDWMLQGALLPQHVSARQSTGAAVQLCSCGARPAPVAFSCCASGDWMLPCHHAPASRCWDQWQVHMEPMCDSHQYAELVLRSRPLDQPKASPAQSKATASSRKEVTQHLAPGRLEDRKSSNHTLFSATRRAAAAQARNAGSSGRQPGSEGSPRQ